MSQNGKGKGPKKGYNNKNWYKNYDGIKNWGHKKKSPNVKKV